MGRNTAIHWADLTRGDHDGALPATGHNGPHPDRIRAIREIGPDIDVQAKVPARGEFGAAPARLTILYKPWRKWRKRYATPSSTDSAA